MTIAEVIQAGRDRLVSQGWCKKALANRAGNVCANGALWNAKIIVNERGWSDCQYDHTLPGREASDLLSQVVADWYGEKYYYRSEHFEGVSAVGQIVAFNNAEETTLNDVLAVFDEGIRRAKEMEG